jgi:hypothetical protein
MILSITMQEEKMISYISELNNKVTKQDTGLFNQEDDFGWYPLSLIETEETESWTANLRENWGLN